MDESVQLSKKRKICNENYKDDQKSKESPHKTTMTKEQLTQLKLKLREQQKIKMEYPKVLIDAQFSVTDCLGPVSPLYVQDVQHFILTALMEGYNPFFPRWCRFLRCGKVCQVVVIVVDNVRAESVDNSIVEMMKSSTSTMIEVYSPKSYSSSVAEELLCVPTSKTKIRKMKGTEEYRQPRDLGAVHNWFREVYRRDKKLSEENKTCDNGDNFPRTQLLMNPVQMLLENYPWPGEMHVTNDFVFTQDEYKPVNDNSPMFAVDCEMCLTTIHKNELTRVSIIDEQLNVIYDTLVKPRNYIINYLTRYSGITEPMLRNVTVTLRDVQRKFRELLPADAILCGQSLNSDLNALKLIHPYVIDTSIIYNLNGARCSKTGLKKLSKLFLDADIQMGNDGHSPIEDSAFTMKLVKLKLSQDITFGDVIMGWQGNEAPNCDAIMEERKNNQEEEEEDDDNYDKYTYLQDTCNTGYVESIYNILKTRNKTAGVIGSTEALDKYSLKDVFKDHGALCVPADDEEQMTECLKEHVSKLDFVLVHQSGTKLKPWGLKDFEKKIIDNMRDSSLLITIVAPKKSANNIICNLQIKAEKLPSSNLVATVL